MSTPKSAVAKNRSNAAKRKQNRRVAGATKKRKTRASPSQGKPRPNVRVFYSGAGSGRTEMRQDHAALDVLQDMEIHRVMPDKVSKHKGACISLDAIMLEQIDKEQSLEMNVRLGPRYDERRLADLEEEMADNGYCKRLVVRQDPATGLYVILGGVHRYLTLLKRLRHSDWVGVYVLHHCDVQHVQNALANRLNRDHGERVSRQDTLIGAYEDFKKARVPKEEICTLYKISIRAFNRYVKLRNVRGELANAGVPDEGFSEQHILYFGKILGETRNHPGVFRLLAMIAWYKGLRAAELETLADDALDREAAGLQHRTAEDVMARAQSWYKRQYPGQDIPDFEAIEPGETPPQPERPTGTAQIRKLIANIKAATTSGRRGGVKGNPLARDLSEIGIYGRSRDDHAKYEELLKAAEPLHTLIHRIYKMWRHPDKAAKTTASKPRTQKKKAQS